ncbi:MAG: hydrogenase maturation protease [Acidimicrobiales bacterium]
MDVSLPNAIAENANGDILVIGYGNDLRHDDGAGRCVADAIEKQRLDGVLNGVTVRSIPQLVPELIADLGAASHVVFVDAAVRGTNAQVTTELIVPAAGPVRSHISTPADLLGLMESLELVRPPSYLVTVPAFDLSVGEGLSERGAQAVRVAITEVSQLIEGLRQE